MDPPAAPVAADVRCPNCGASAPGRFCATCGQRQDRRLASVRRMAAEAVEDQFSLGSALPRTLAALVLHPGCLTADYLAGKVARYVAPFRLYLVASLVFFVLLSWRADFRDAVLVDAADDAMEEAAERRPGGIVSISVAEGEVGDFLDVDVDTLEPGPLLPARRWMQRRIDRVNAMEGEELRDRLFDRFQANAPKAVFLILPLYALLLKLVYLRRKRLYAEHFIFALHTHAFAFLLFTLLIFLPSVLDQVALLVWLPTYLLLAMRRVYGQSIPLTLLKFFLLFIGYSAVLGAVLGATALVSVLTV